jgi:hypothetical protein
MTKTKPKAPRSSKQSKQKLVELMRELEKNTVATPKKAVAGSCVRIYCTPW